MPDWLKFVRQRLADLALDSAEKDEVHAELAAHLEDFSESVRARRLSEEDVTREVLAQTGDWQELQREISIAKKGVSLMQKRVQQLWIPGFLTLTISAVFLMTLQKSGFQPRVIPWSGPGENLLLYTPWLLSLPVFGAVGAYLSSRAGGSWRTMFFASTFPVLTYAATIIVVLPISLVIDSHVQHNITLAGFAHVFFQWVVIPGVALLAGGLPTQLFLSRRLTGGAVVNR